MKFKSDIIIECGEKRIVAKSVLNVMAAGIKCGTEVTLICDGVDEAEAMESISEAIESGLGEK
jgi:phosphocarrier protein